MNLKHIHFFTNQNAFDFLRRPSTATICFCFTKPHNAIISVFSFFGVSQQPYYLALLGHHFQSLKLFIPIMRQHLRHFQQNLNLKSILVQETSDNVTTTPDLESLFSIMREEDRFYFEDKKKPYKIVFNFPSIYSTVWVDFSQLFDPFHTYLKHGTVMGSNICEWKQKYL